MSENTAQDEVNMIAQYIKDFSFENLNPLSRLELNEQPKFTLNVDVVPNVIDKENHIYVVDLIINVNAKVKDHTLFVSQLDYCGEFYANVADEKLRNVLFYVEFPRLLFPFARAIISNATMEANFPPLLLAPVNFDQLYLNKMQENNQTRQ